MNGIKLSSDLGKIELEIEHHKQMAGQSIWEIGRRLNHVKESDLVHGEFGEWLGRIKMTSNAANRFMKIARELPANSPTLENMGTTALDLIASLPEEEREKVHKLANGETKRTHDMTVRELQEVKRELAKSKQQLEKVQESEQIAIKKLEEEQSKDPIKVEVPPSDYEQLKDSYTVLTGKIKELETVNKGLNNDYERLADEIESVDEKSKKYDELNEAMKKMSGRLSDGQRQIKAQKEVYDLIKSGEEAVKMLAPLSFLVDGESIAGNDYASKPILKLVKNLEDISGRLRKSLDKTTIIEG